MQQGHPGEEHNPWVSTIEGESGNGGNIQIISERTLSAITQSVIFSKPWVNLTRGHGHDGLCQMNACYFIITCDKPSVGGSMTE